MYIVNMTLDVDIYVDEDEAEDKWDAAEVARQGLHAHLDDYCEIQEIDYHYTVEE